MINDTKCIVNAHSNEVEFIEKTLKTDKEKGLRTLEFENLVSIYGLNQIETTEKESILKLLFNQINQPLIYILLASSLVTAFMREWVDTIVILGVVIVNAIIGFLQELKAIKALDSLTKSMDTETTVIRDGEKIRISSEKLVPGDIVFLQSGDKVPADIRLFKAIQLKAEEAALTLKWRRIRLLIRRPFLKVFFNA